MVPKELSDQPEYQYFRKAIAERKAPLVVVCGSGLSAPAGLPTWPALRRTLQQNADQKERALNQIGHALLKGRVEAARKQPDTWVAFKLLKEALTRPVFDKIVEQELSPDESVETPPSYEVLLKLQPRGLVTLNLDKFAGEALSRRYPGEIITPVYGKELAQKWNLLKSAKTYLIYLHGGIHDPSTWVMTQDDLTSLLSSPGHSHFLHSMFTENIVLFVGVSADDIALSGRLMELTSAGFRPKNLYWLTTRLDAHTSRWASDAYVSLIQYSASSHDQHGAVLKALVEDCLNFVSEDEPQPPLIGAGRQFEETISKGPILDPEELAQEQPEKIRRTIAAELDALLTNVADKRSLYEKYRAFCADYEFAVDRSFFRGRADKYREWFGYKLQMPALGRGNFGEVYSAEDESGHTVAVKIMHKSIFGNDDMLGGFRRGVRSMDIVTQANIRGMVPLVESFELPPTIVMPFVGGHSLQEALEIRSDLDWSTKLEIALEVGRIVGEGHALPDTILHRDLKPSNIMIANLEYQGPFHPEVYVLDFDMSWHKGSKEKDVVFESRDDFGFLAPEQTDPTNRYAARSTRVDSYGFGMTLFYMFGLEAPRPNEALSDLWLGRAIRAARRGYSGRWRSAPIRLGRLISLATQVDQNDRIDFATFVRELRFLHTATTTQNILDNPELWAEELLAEIAQDANYQWDDAVGTGRLETHGGIAIETGGDFRSGAINFNVRYIDRGVKERSHVAKYVGPAAQSAQRALKAKGWTILEQRSGGLEAVVRTECKVQQLIENGSSMLTAAREAIQEFNF